MNPYLLKEEILTQVSGYVALTANSPLVPWQFQRRQLHAEDVLIKILYSGICHSDIHQVREEWGESLFPMVPGHEIVGTVEALGDSVTKFSLGDLVGVGVYIDSCRSCTNCRNGESHYCDEGMTGTYNGYERDGKTIAQGGYSSAIVVDQNYVVSIPENLEPSGVAPLLCAGITLYSPLKHWQAKSDRNVGIIGLGGLGHLGVKFAKALGANVSVLSHSQNKEADAYSMGADNFFLTKDKNIFNKFKKHFDLLINTVSAPIDLNEYLELLKLDGTLVLVGLSGQPYPVDAFNLLNQRRRIAGSMIGSVSELQEMLNFASKNKIVSNVEVIKATQINEAYERVLKSDVKYRFVIDASSF